MRNMLLGSVAACALMMPSASWADMAAAEKWVDNEFQPSTLSRDEQLKEMEWFINAAKPFDGMEINVLSEGPLGTHDYESQVLTKAFEEITGIKVNHQELGEGEVVQAVQTQMQTNRNLYDAYINDFDLIGTHSRLQSARNLTDWMAGEGKDVTNPMLDIDDFIGKSFTTGPDGKLYQLPDQQFANLYWFRKDWFDRPELQEKFKAKYGYDLGVPVNWSAYEDIAEFFTNDVKEIDGVRVYGHMDYGKRAPDLGWRMTDAWLSMAGIDIPRSAERTPDRRMGNSNGGRVLQSRWRVGFARRRAERSGLRLRDRQMGRMAAQICASGCRRPRLLPVPACSEHRQRCSADLLVHLVHADHGEAESGRQQHRRRGRQFALENGSLTSRPVLERRHEAWIPGRRFVDYPEIDPGRPCEGRMALCTVRRLEDRGREEDPCRPYDHPRQHDSASFLYRTGTETGRLGRVLPFARSRELDRRPASTYRTIPGLRRSGGSRSAT